MPPTGPVTVSIDGGDHVGVTPHTLTFSRADYATPKRVTLRAADDPARGAVPATAEITHTTTGGGYDRQRRATCCPSPSPARTDS